MMMIVMMVMMIIFNEENLTLRCFSKGATNAVWGLFFKKLFHFAHNGLFRRRGKLRKKIKQCTTYKMS